MKNILFWGGGSCYICCVQKREREREFGLRVFCCLRVQLGIVYGPRRRQNAAQLKRDKTESHKSTEFPSLHASAKTSRLGNAQFQVLTNDPSRSHWLMLALNESAGENDQTAGSHCGFDNTSSAIHPCHVIVSTFVTGFCFGRVVFAWPVFSFLAMTGGVTLAEEEAELCLTRHQSGGSRCCLDSHVIRLVPTCLYLLGDDWFFQHWRWK